MLICCLRNISDYYQCLKQVLINIFVETVIHFSEYLDEYEVQKSRIFGIEIFCNIINIFTVTFDQFKNSCLNKSINFFKKCRMQSQKSVKHCVFMVKILYE